MNYQAHWYNNLINFEFIIWSIAIWIIANYAREKQYDFARGKALFFTDVRRVLKMSYSIELYCNLISLEHLSTLAAFWLRINEASENPH